jgi:hypothetical protein
MVGSMNFLRYNYGVFKKRLILVLTAIILMGQAAMAQPGDKMRVTITTGNHAEGIVIPIGQAGPYKMPDSQLQMRFLVIDNEVVAWVNAPDNAILFSAPNNQHFKWTKDDLRKGKNHVLFAKQAIKPDGSINPLVDRKVYAPIGTIHAVLATK